MHRFFPDLFLNCYFKSKDLNCLDVELIVNVVTGETLCKKYVKQAASPGAAAKE